MLGAILYGFLSVIGFAFLNRYRGAPSYKSLEERLKTDTNFTMPAFFDHGYVRRKLKWFDAKLWAYLPMSLIITVIIIAQAPDWLGALSFLSFFGVWLGYAKGWGKYFPHGMAVVQRVGASPIYVYKEKEVAVIDWLTTKIMGDFHAHSMYKQAKNWQTFAMSLRMIILGAGIFLPVFALTQNWFAFAAIFLTGLAGFIYKFFYRQHTRINVTNQQKHNNEELAEYATGAWIGILLTATYIVGL